MPHYVMLNFEDADPGAAPGLVTGVKGKNVLTVAGIGSAAAGTARIYHNRALARSTWYKRKEAVYYGCQEILQRDQANTLAEGDLDNIRKDCRSAKTIAFIIHGQPGETEHGFATTSAPLCTWKELGSLALLLLPPGKSYNIALIMCYGGRSENARIDHRGQIPDIDLKTSFAYKFFRRICRKRQVQMTARTGAVSNDGSLNHTVEKEEQVFLVLKTQKAMAKRALNKVTMDAQKNQLFLKSKLSPQVFNQQFDVALMQFVNNPQYAPQNAMETFAQRYIIYSPYMRQYLTNTFNPDDLGNTHKYGKLIYTYDGHELRIIARYDTGNGPNYELYRGRLL
jgi:hypothetical protein